jgi:1-deoxy-D-xylulose-5-phosphate synthase
MNEQELRNLMYTSQLERNGKAFTIRYPRGQGIMPEWRTPFEEIEIGTGRTMAEGDDLAILTIGHIGNYVTEVVERLQKDEINPGHYDMRFVKPLDEKLLDKIFSKYSKVITVEDGTIAGGFGSAVLEYMASKGYHAKVKMLGIPDHIVEHGTQLELHKECGFDPDGIYETAVKMLEPSYAE